MQLPLLNARGPLQLYLLIPALFQVKTFIRFCLYEKLKTCIFTNLRTKYTYFNIYTYINSYTIGYIIAFIPRWFFVDKLFLCWLNSIGIQNLKTVFHLLSRGIKKNVKWTEIRKETEPGRTWKNQVVLKSVFKSQWHGRFINNLAWIKKTQFNS